MSISFRNGCIAGPLTSTCRRIFERYKSRTLRATGDPDGQFSVIPPATPTSLLGILRRMSGIPWLELGWLGVGGLAFSREPECRQANRIDLLAGRR